MMFHNALCVWCFDLEKIFLSGTINMREQKIQVAEAPLQLSYKKLQKI